MIPAVRRDLVARARDALHQIASHRSRDRKSHTSELQSQSNLVCRLLLEKKTSLTIRTSCAATRPSATTTTATTSEPSSCDTRITYQNSWRISSDRLLT